MYTYIDNSYLAASGLSLPMTIKQAWVTDPIDKSN